MRHGHGYGLDIFWHCHVMIRYFLGLPGYILDNHRRDDIDILTLLFVMSTLEDVLFKDIYSKKNVASTTRRRDNRRFRFTLA